MKTGHAKAYTNIALIKYWGKKNDALILPMNDSLSLTLDAFYSQTSVTFDEKLTQDTFTLNGEVQNEEKSKKVFAFMDLVRARFQVKEFARIESVNTVPTAAGLASSASGFAALAGAVNAALELDLDEKALSKLARRGSGSATRSVYGGFAQWQQGTNDEDSYAVPIDSDGFEDELMMLFIVLDKKEKTVGSRQGMKSTVETSVFYSGWLEKVNADLILMKEAIEDKNFVKVSEIAESNALAMHATTLGANPAFTYWQKESMEAMDHVRNLRAKGVPVYFTMDAGPNVKVLLHKENKEQVLSYFEQFYPTDKLLIASSGPAMEMWHD
ncbi:MAG: diphosphomevalonate decarboxylase [Streptococcaceae bacterium]|jgi:diphosphomevalonate decarboxylase|nr:diphosphomevalonate decarboxylase [Streptococcaceae bacterium]